MRRLILLASLVLGIVATVPTSASAVESTGNDTFKIKGLVLTSADLANTTDQMQPLIVTSSVHPSTVSGLGRVTLHQPQVVMPDPASPPFGSHTAYYGTLSSSATDRSYFAAADGSRLYFTFTTSYQAFEPTTRVIPSGVPWPIAFPAKDMEPFQITFTGGTGRFAGATGTALGSGSYCFMLNQGYYTLDGTVTLPNRI